MDSWGGVFQAKGTAGAKAKAGSSTGHLEEQRRGRVAGGECTAWIELTWAQHQTQSRHSAGIY